MSTKKSTISPFTFVNNISYSKRDIYEESNGDGNYVPFLTNKYFSLFIDTILLANDLNIHHHVDYRMQHDFLLNTVRKRNRRADWLKKQRDDDVTLIMQYYGCNEQRAKEALNILTAEQIASIRHKTDTGGVNKK